jgi:hypothetical protein
MERGCRSLESLGPTLQTWFGSVTQKMLDLAQVGLGQRVLDLMQTVLNLKTSCLLKGGLAFLMGKEG